MQTLYKMGKFVEGEEYAKELVENFGNYVILEGAKDRGILFVLFSPFLFAHSYPFTSMERKAKRKANIFLLPSFLPPSPPSPRPFLSYLLAPTKQVIFDSKRHVA